MFVCFLWSLEHKISFQYQDGLIHDDQRQKNEEIDLFSTWLKPDERQRWWKIWKSDLKQISFLQ